MQLKIYLVTFIIYVLCRLNKGRKIRTLQMQQKIYLLTFINTIILSVKYWVQIIINKKNQGVIQV